jgi:hypothetical protein
MVRDQNRRINPAESRAKSSRLVLSLSVRSSRKPKATGSAGACFIEWRPLLTLVTSPACSKTPTADRRARTELAAYITVTNAAPPDRARSTRRLDRDLRLRDLRRAAARALPASIRGDCIGHGIRSGGIADVRQPFLGRWMGFWRRTGVRRAHRKQVKTCIHGASIVSAVNSHRITDRLRRKFSRHFAEYRLARERVLSPRQALSRLPLFFVLTDIGLAAILVYGR